MARGQSSTVVKVLGACVAVIAGGAAFGWLFGNVRDTHPAVQPAQTPVSTTLAPRPAITPSSVHPHMANGNYTAPGAPRITIEEESSPILRRTLPPPPPKADPEATQEATQVVTKPQAGEAKTPDATHPATSQTPDTPLTPKLSPDAGTTGTQTTPVPPPPAPADPDFERVNTPKPAQNSDPASGQQGTGTGTKTTTDSNTNRSNTNKVQFRVQTGAYTDESNARSVADTLRGEGYSTSTRSERDGDHLVYKVQVGAYHSKVSANKAADDLQKKGYPAFISPIGP